MIPLVLRRIAFVAATIVTATCTMKAQQLAWSDSLVIPAGHRLASVQMIATSDGGVLAIGDEDTTVGGGSFQPNIMLLKFSSEGTHLWTRHIRGAYGMRFAHAYELRGGSIMVAGNEEIDSAAATLRWSPMVMAVRANGDSIWKALYGPPPPDNSNFAHCFSIYGVVNDQSLLLCAGSNYTFAYRIDGLGTIGATRTVLQAPYPVWLDFRSTPDYIDLISQTTDNMITATHVSNDGDSIGTTTLDLTTLGAAQDRSIANVAPSSTGAYMIGMTTAIDLSPKQRKPMMARYDENGLKGPVSIFFGGGSNDLLLRRVAAVEPGTYFALPDMNGFLVRLTQDEPDMTVLTFNVAWRFTDVIPASNKFYFAFGYTDPDNNLLPHIAKIGVGASGVENTWWRPIEKLNLW